MTYLEKIAAEEKACHWTNKNWLFEQAAIFVALAVIVIALGIISILEFNTTTALIIVSGEISLFGGYLLLQYIIKKKKDKNDDLILTCAALARTQDYRPEYIAYMFEENHVAFSRPQNKAFNELLLAYLSEVVENLAMHDSKKLKKWEVDFPYLMKKLRNN